MGPETEGPCTDPALIRPGMVYTGSIAEARWSPVVDVGPCRCPACPVTGPGPLLVVVSDGAARWTLRHPRASSFATREDLRKDTP